MSVTYTTPTTPYSKLLYWQFDFSTRYAYRDRSPKNVFNHFQIFCLKFLIFFVIFNTIFFFNFKILKSESCMVLIRYFLNQKHFCIAVFQNDQGDIFWTSVPAWDVQLGMQQHASPDHATFFWMWALENLIFKSRNKKNHSYILIQILWKYTSYS